MKPPNLTIKLGDVRRASEQYIVQQCCCIATKPHGLSSVLAKAFPGSCPYSTRRNAAGKANLARVEDRPTPGTLTILGVRRVVSLFAQHGMGKPGQWPAPAGTPDTAADRVRYFRACLDALAALKPSSVALPYGIGCGLAGGDWNGAYWPALCAFAAASPDMRVVLYKFGAAAAAPAKPPVKRAREIAHVDR
jgi:O-acetyl-ADP-ribose deacetylase (regulator of RNase III)